MNIRKHYSLESKAHKCRNSTNTKPKNLYQVMWWVHYKVQNGVNRNTNLHRENEEQTEAFPHITNPIIKPALRHEVKAQNPSAHKNQIFKQWAETKWELRIMIKLNRKKPWEHRVQNSKESTLHSKTKIPLQKIQQYTQGSNSPHTQKSKLYSSDKTPLSVTTEFCCFKG